MSKKITFDTIFMVFSVYSVKDNRNSVSTFQIKVETKTIHKAWMLAKKKLSTLINNDPSVISTIEFKGICVNNKKPKEQLKSKNHLKNE